MAEIHPLKAFRERHDPPLSQKDLGDLLAVDRLTIHRWETGKRQPAPEQLPVISSKTGIPPRELRPDLAKLLGDAA